MRERFEPGEPLPEITPGELLRQTPNLQVVTDYKLGLEGRREGERFYIQPRTIAGSRMLEDAAIAHNIYNFDIRPVYGVRDVPRTEYVPALRADYTPDNFPVLFDGVVRIPSTGGDTIPSPDRMEACLAKGDGFEFPRYTFTDDLPPDYQIPNYWARFLRLQQAMFSDMIPEYKVRSDDPNHYYKVTKGWFSSVAGGVSIGVHLGEFRDPQLVEFINAFRDKYMREEFTQALTTAEDIADANKLIDTIWVASQAQAA